MYEITAYSKKKAKQLGVIIKPSTVKYKKIDVFKKDKLIASIGDNRYKDYPTYILEKGKTYADKRRALYHGRHLSSMEGINGFYAKNILW